MRLIKFLHQPDIELIGAVFRRNGTLVFKLLFKIEATGSNLNRLRNNLRSLGLEITQGMRITMIQSLMDELITQQDFNERNT